jgi:transposase
MTYDELVKLVQDQAALISKLQKRVEELEAELKKYKNSNTPPSANKHLKPNTRGKSKKSKKKRGAQKGHKGITRQQQPDRKEKIDTDCCPNCGSKNLKDKKIYKKTIEELPEPVTPEIVEYEIHEKKCLDCKHSFIPDGCTIPHRGKFGFNIMVLVVFLKYILRGVLRKIVHFLNVGYGLKLTPASIGAILERVARAADREYEELKKRIQSAARVYVDETSFSVLGTNYWVWVFRTANDLLLVIRPSRGRDVLQEILGEDFQGIVICDCWRAYNFIDKLQRCWSHLLRKAKKTSNSLVAKNLYKNLKSLFAEIKAYNIKKHSLKNRKQKYVSMTQELNRLVKYYKKYEELKEIIVYIGNNLENWFTCILYENIEPTNNYAEQAIRETVIVRKIIGAFRSEQGPENYSILASLLATWKIRGLNICSRLKATLLQYRQFC